MDDSTISVNGCRLENMGKRGAVRIGRLQARESLSKYLLCVGRWTDERNRRDKTGSPHFNGGTPWDRLQVALAPPLGRPWIAIGSPLDRPPSSFVIRPTSALPTPQLTASW